MKYNFLSLMLLLTITRIHSADFEQVSSKTTPVTLKFSKGYIEKKELSKITPPFSLKCHPIPGDEYTQDNINTSNFILLYEDIFAAPLNAKKNLGKFPKLRNVQDQVIYSSSEQYIIVKALPKDFFKIWKNDEMHNEASICIHRESCEPKIILQQIESTPDEKYLVVAHSHTKDPILYLTEYIITIYSNSSNNEKLQRLYKIVTPNIVLLNDKLSKLGNGIFLAALGSMIKKDAHKTESTMNTLMMLSYDNGYNVKGSEK